MAQFALENEEVIDYSKIKNRFKYHKLDEIYNPIFLEIREMKIDLKIEPSSFLIKSNKLSDVVKP